MARSSFYLGRSLDDNLYNFPNSRGIKPFMHQQAKSFAEPHFRQFMRHSAYRSPLAIATASAVQSEWAKQEEAVIKPPVSLSPKMAERIANYKGSADVLDRPYVDLTTVARIELRGDYLCEAGMFQEALEHYGACAKAYLLAYPSAHHNQHAKILIKLARAFRCTDRLEAAQANLERSFMALENVEEPLLENVLETCLEMGLTLKAKGDLAQAAAVLEDTVNLSSEFHSIGASHRQIRYANYAFKSFHKRQHGKFVYVSPYERDRCFSIVDRSLELAEEAYSADADTNEASAEGLRRVLEMRVQFQDQKHFNMNNFCFRIRTKQGKNKTRQRWVSDSPTAEELLKWTPTLHQPYFDYSRERVAPLGEEHLVDIGQNARYVDDADPLRRHMSKHQQQGQAEVETRDHLRKYWNKQLPERMYQNKKWLIRNLDHK